MPGPLRAINGEVHAPWIRAGQQCAALRHAPEKHWCYLTTNGCLSPAQDCLALGAIFATTDSVAVLQVLEPDRAPLLFNLVFGEGVINDATTVALLRTIQVLHLPLSAP